MAYKYNPFTDKLDLWTVSSEIDHGGVQGLADDDHLQYSRTDGTRNVTGNQTFEANVTISGNLTVQGSQFITNTETVTIEDNTIVLNNGEAGAGVTLGTAGIEIDRGSSAVAWLLFDEPTDSWRAGVSGTMDDIALEGWVTSADSTLSGILSAEIDSDIAAHHDAASADHDDRYYTESEVDALLASVSGSLGSGYIAADAALSGTLYAGYTAADAVVTAAYIAADTTLSGELYAGYVAADAVVSAAYIAADSTLSGILSAEIDADIVTHAAVVDAHHTRYTDAEAISATASARATLSGVLSSEIDSDIATFSGTIDHNTILNNHNLTTDIDHDALTNFSADEHFTWATVSATIDHDTILNNHNLTTDIDHDQLTNFTADEHFTQAAISITESQISDLQSYLLTVSGGDHATLTNLDYASAGHTGFAPTSHTHTESQISDLGTYLENVVEDTTPQLGGDLDLNGKNIDFGAILTVSGTYKGEIMTATVDDASSVFGSLLVQGADFHYDRADADAAATAGAVVIALEAGTGSKKVLIKGQVCDTAWNWNAGKMYISTAIGEMTQTKPSGSGDQVQVVGWALSADTVFFDPDRTTIEVA